jgi:hypothetical protein
MLNRENEGTRRKHASVPLCPPQIPHDLTLARNRDPAVGSRRLAASAKKLSFYIVIYTATFLASFAGNRKQ